MTIEVYAFEDKDGESVTDWTTQDIAEAREFARQNKCVLIARQYEYTDSEVVEDYAEDDRTECVICGEPDYAGLLDPDGRCPDCLADIEREGVQE